jgi:peptidoglycan/xylan/chitin deacetylase (PgdA/CDA1 family)
MDGITNTIFKLRSRLHGLPRDAGWQLGLNRSFITNAKGARILVYHGICKNDPLKFNTLFVKLKTIELQLRLYKKYFNLISLDDFYEQRFSDKQFNICLSFDDGFANNYKYVLPLLEKYQVPATFFLTGIRQAGYDILWNDILCMAYKYGPEKFTFRLEEFIKAKDGKYMSSVNGKRLGDILRSTEFEPKKEMIAQLEIYKHKANDDYWLQMTTAQIRSLASSKWATIGGHGYYHNDLAKISATSVKEDLARSKGFLENITGKEIKALAFPYGSYSKQVIEEAKQAGYRQLLATEFLFKDDINNVLLQERFTVNPFISNINQLYANIAGKY